MAHEPASAEAHRGEYLQADVHGPGPLTARDRAILSFELRVWRHAGEKEEAIRREFDIAAARYYQVLNALVDSPAALVHDPMLVRRLHRVRESHSRNRTMRPGGTPAPGR